MNNSLFNFRDEEEREMFFVAIPVIALFAVLGYWLMKGEAPEVTSPVAMVASVDSDGDGVTDASDRCVNVSGDIASYGCPAKVAWADRDNDTDGIRNGIDSCPESKGVAANNGCAVKKTAIAASAAATSVAAAPIIASPLQAVDTDGDGVVDQEDSCPDIAGLAAEQGCLPTPDDADNDGVVGAADQCPDAMGSAMSNGCPADTDGDGVDDMADACPTIAGSVDGCPADADADGVADAVDECPSDAGLEVNRGCPADADGDGVSDATDRCPQTPGVASNEGCAADSDGDGIADANDQCPDIAGTSATGCPVVANTDTDGDGVNDDSDSCPSIRGMVANAGCPIDSDNDGIADEDDKCPATAGVMELLGCPASTADTTAVTAPTAAPTANVSSTLSTEEEVRQVLDAAVRGVKFNSNSSVLTARSRELLRSIAGLMKKYPNTVLDIRGHTDSSGNAQKNITLSMQRARSCATFISAEGVSLDRLKAYGYGDSQPVADNSSRIGREQNRRVEFELINF